MFSKSILGSVVSKVFLHRKKKSTLPATLEESNCTSSLEEDNQEQASEEETESSCLDVEVERMSENETWFRSTHLRVKTTQAYCPSLRMRLNPWGPKYLKVSKGQVLWVETDAFYNGLAAVHLGWDFKGYDTCGAVPLDILEFDGKF